MFLLPAILKFEGIDIQIHNILDCMCALCTLYPHLPARLFYNYVGENAKNNCYKIRNGTIFCG